MISDRTSAGDASEPADVCPARVKVLRVAARHDDLLSREAFEQLADALADYVPFGRMGVVLREGQERRIHAVTRGHTQPTEYAFGSRFPVAEHPSLAFLDAGRPFICDDTRTGHPVDERTADAGFASYVAIPIRTGGTADGAVCGHLAVAFRERGRASLAPLEVLGEVTSVLGSSLARSIARARDRRLAMILETSETALLAWDSEGRVTDVNAAACRLTRHDREQLVGMAVADLLGPIDANDPTPRDGRMWLRRRDDEPAIVVAATVSAVPDDPLVSTHALLRDVSHIVTAEREATLHLSRVRELEAELRTLLDNAPLIIFRLDPGTGDLRYLNRHAERLLGVPTAEALATPGFLRATHVDPAGIDAFDGASALARRGVVSPPYEARLRYGDGPEIVVRGTVYPLLSDGGHVVAIEGVLADVSAEQVARTRLVQADRLLSLGMLAAGVAHEINNPAAFILLGLDMLDRMLRTSTASGMDPAAPELVSELRDSIRRIVDIARDLRLFASPPSPESGRGTIVDVNRTVDSALTLTRGQIIERAQIVRHLEEVPPVLMDDGRLGQVIVNLLVNAAQAIPKSWSRANAVTIATRSDGRVVEIEVTDTGVGIPDEHLSRIFTPFFTTKGPEVGTGLGLSISREIVERAGGGMRVESPASTGPDGDQRGARFVITLPAAGRRESMTPGSQPLPRVPRQRLHVLVVEDEAPLARALAEELGVVHEVEVVHRAETALGRFADKRFDVVLCDLRMPGMSGEALYGRVLESNPGQAGAFLFMTGAGFGADVERFLATSGRPVLDKPFSAERALTAIAKMIGKGPRGPEAQGPRAESERETGRGEPSSDPGALG